MQWVRQLTETARRAHIAARGLCVCGNPGGWVRDPAVPIGYDTATNEFFLEATGSCRIFLRYCPSCGGRLVSSSRNLHFQKPDPLEVDDIEERFARIMGEEDVKHVLGEPTRVHPSVRLDRHVLSRQYGTMTQYDYEDIYRTIVVVVQVHSDGKLLKTYFGKYNRTAPVDRRGPGPD